MIREQILDAAKRCVCQDRNQQYGEPEDNFSVIARFWQEYIYGATGKTINITSLDVANMMILLKVARVATGSGSQDNWIDLAGYAACGGEIEGKSNDPSIDRH